MAGPEGHHIQVGKNSVDVDRMTQQLEQGRTNILESVMWQTQTNEQRHNILELVQKTNADHRKANPNLPTLTLDEYSDWPSSWGRNRDLNLKRPNETQAKTIYEIMDWKGDDKKDHKVQNVPYNPEHR